MGKTYKGKDKAKAKANKAKRKIARKCKGAALVLAAATFAILAGCSTSESAQPAKSQTQNNSFEDCIIVVAAKVRVPVAGTNQTITADGGEMPTLELFTQTQALESSGTETYSPAATQTPTTDVKPDIDVTVPVNKAGTANTLGSTLGDAAAALINGVTSGGTSSANTNCTNGNCTYSASGSTDTATEE